ncbi:MAG TPA: dockerin type I repeat-containing protein, partial [Armatimonadota bacterium]
GAQYTIEAAGTYVDSLGHETVAKVTSGTLTVKATAPPSGAKGDVNGDGKVSVGDVVLALRAVAGLAQLSAQQSVAADVNGDGKLSVGDVVLLLRVVARLITLGA